MGKNFDKLIGFNTFDTKIVKYLEERGFTKGVMSPVDGDRGYDLLTLNADYYVLGFSITSSISKITVGVKLYLNEKDLYVQVRGDDYVCLDAIWIEMVGVNTVDKVDEILEEVEEFLVGY